MPLLTCSPSADSIDKRVETSNEHFDRLEKRAIGYGSTTQEPAAFKAKAKKSSFKSFIHKLTGKKSQGTSKTSQEGGGQTTNTPSSTTRGVSRGDQVPLKNETPTTASNQHQASTPAVKAKNPTLREQLAREYAAEHREKHPTLREVLAEAAAKERKSRPPNLIDEYRRMVAKKRETDAKRKKYVDKEAAAAADPSTQLKGKGKEEIVRDQVSGHSNKVGEITRQQSDPYHSGRHHERFDDPHWNQSYDELNELPLQKQLEKAKEELKVVRSRSSLIPTLLGGKDYGSAGQVKEIHERIRLINERIKSEEKLIKFRRTYMTEEWAREKFEDLSAQYRKQGKKNPYETYEHFASHYRLRGQEAIHASQASTSRA